MLLRNILFVLVLLTGVIRIQAQEEVDVDGGKDHPLLSRMPGFYIFSYEAKDYDSYQSGYVKGEDAVWEGERTTLNYSIKSGAKKVSMHQIVQNYEKAVKKIGGTVLYTGSRVIDMKIKKNNSIAYVHVEAFNDGNDYELIIVEAKAMEEEVTVDADALKNSIAETGKAVVYGIYFDTGKSIIKPESKPVLDELAKLLKNNPRLSLYVVGHTDSDGTLDFNLKLSADRGASVVNSLIERGIESSRLKSAGAGPYCPVASNKTEEGKAKNRRVEFVDQK